MFSHKDSSSRRSRLNPSGRGCGCGGIPVIGRIAFFLFVPILLWVIGVADPCVAVMPPDVHCVILPNCPRWAASLLV